MANENLKFFNLTLADKEKISEFQNHCCGLCGKKLGKKGQLLRLDVEHDHTSGLIRSLICFPCNRVIGSLTVEMCQKILDYLLNPPATQALGAPRYGLPGRVNTKKQRKLYKKLQKAQNAGKASKPKAKRVAPTVEPSPFPENRDDLVPNGRVAGPTV